MKYYKIPLQDDELKTIAKAILLTNPNFQFTEDDHDIEKFIKATVLSTSKQLITLNQLYTDSPQE